MKKNIIKAFATLVIIAAGASIFLWLKNQKKEVEAGAPTPVLPKVRVMKSAPGSNRVQISGYGTVAPLREVQISPQVAGKIIYISPNLVNGGELKEEEVLVKIDSADYDLSLTSLKAKTADSESSLRLIEEEAGAAVAEWRRVHGKNGKKPPALVAKEPQLAAAKARLEADIADLRKAELQVQRCVITAPFESRVNSKNMDLGQYATPGQTLASVFSVEASEISVALDADSLKWLYVPGFTSVRSSSKALVTTRIAGIDKSWTGKIVRAEGKIDPKTRMIKVVVRVNKPYESLPPLAAGLFVDVEFKGKEIKDSVEIPRNALRDNNIVWVIDDEGRLRFRKVETALIAGNTVIIQKGLKDGEYVAVSDLKVMSDGMKVRKIVLAEKKTGDKE